MDKTYNKSLSLRRMSSMLFFIFLAALLWIIIKLSSNYTVTEHFTAYFTNVPSEKLLNTDNQQIKASLSTTGFKLLNYYFKPVKKRSIYLNLNEIPYYLNYNNKYAINSVYAEEQIAILLDINENEVKINESEINFILDNLSSKLVPVVPNINMSFEKQYNIYGKPIVIPDSVTIYGSEDVISSLKDIGTKNITLKNLNKSIVIDAQLDLLDNRLHTDNQSVKIDIDVEKFTEAIVEVPIEQNNNLKLRYFPEKIQVKYVVSLKDYNKINSLSFRAEIDTISLANRERLLPVQLTQYPDKTQIMSITPQEVEYIIIQE